MYLYTLSRNTQIGRTDNDYSRLKALDTIFNLCLIIDEILKVYWKKIRRRKKLLKRHYIHHGIALLSHKEGWLTQNDIEYFWGKLKVMNTPPDIMVPVLLQMKRRFKKGNKMILPSKEVFTMLLAYNLRNYGGHNIKQQRVLTEKFNGIISQLMMALFLSVRAL
jgi:hypothetical protein